tara:strand:- start:684 stop:1019 length:336 start_codon:yes stop_codon:yes gene_type:complete
MIDWNVGNTNTQKTPQEDVSVWNKKVGEPLRNPVDSQTNPPQPNKLDCQHVSKSLPVFSTIFADHVEFNKYMKYVILEHRKKNPETTQSNVKAWHSSWQTHIENPFPTISG